MHERLRIQIGANVLEVDADQLTTLAVCQRSGQVPHECGLNECEYGCSDVELTFVRAEVLAAGFPSSEAPS